MKFSKCGLGGYGPASPKSLVPWSAISELMLVGYKARGSFIPLPLYFMCAGAYWTVELADAGRQTKRNLSGSNMQFCHILALTMWSSSPRHL